MPSDTQQLIDEAEKLGQLVAQHPAVARYKQAQQAMAEDADAKRMLAEFDRQIETLGRQEQSGLAVTDAQRMQLESLQTRIVANPKIKALNAPGSGAAGGAAPGAGAGAAGGPRLTIGKP